MMTVRDLIEKLNALPDHIKDTEVVVSRVKSVKFERFKGRMLVDYRIHGIQAAYPRRIQLLIEKETHIYD